MLICTISQFHNAAVIDAADFSAIQETLYLLSIPGMRESIQEARAEPLYKCSDKLDW